MRLGHRHLAALGSSPSAQSVLRFALVVGLITLGSSFTFAEATSANAPTTAPASLRIATYNIENFFDQFDDPYTTDETSKPKQDAAIEAVAANIRKLNADFVAFQEVENTGVLQAMVKKHLDDMGYTVVHIDQGNGTRGINVGLISRKPIVTVTSHRYRDLHLPAQDKTWRFARDLLEVVVQVTPSRKMTFYLVHLKSKLSEPGDPKAANWRLAEATAASEIIAAKLKADPSAEIVMLGDFNDTPDSPTLSVLLDASNGHAGLIDPHAKLPASARVSYLKEPYRSNIDYILMSPNLSSQVVPDSAVVLTGDDLLKASDHAPVVVNVLIDGPNLGQR